VRTAIATIILLVASALSATATAEAQVCGDANRSGNVTVTDGVLVLRAAADLPTVCPQERCDMNLDDRVSVTDGVLALRLAADIPTQVACSAAQAGAVFGQIVKVLGIGGVSSPAARARSAATTTPCPGGGSQSDDGTTLTFFDCAEGDFVTNGTITLTAVDENVVAAAFATSDAVVSTGEAITTSGTLQFTFGDDDTASVDGVLAYDSSVVGGFTDEFAQVLLDADFLPFSGTVTTTITEGRDFFANVASFTTTIYSPTLVRIFVDYANGDFDVFTLADGLCEPCSSGCSNASLACVACVGECTGATDRCGVDFDVVGCDDGSFGPQGLCEPCTSNDECNASDGLSCFACDTTCSGSTMRCGSSIAFVECEDGTF